MQEIIDLSALQDSDPTQSEADVFRLLNEGLTIQGDAATAPAKLANSLREYGSRFGNPEAVENFLWDLWTTFMNVIRVVPIEHPWHETLIATVDDLRRGGGAVADSDTENLWEDLPQLSMYIFDKWADPTDFPDTVLRDIETWKRWNSFAAGVAARGCQMWAVLPWLQIRAGLETISYGDDTAFDARTLFECKIWAATEWLIRYGGVLFQRLSSSEELRPEELENIGPGPLCEDVSRYTVERWDFWLSRLKELADKKSATIMKEGTPHDVVLSESCLSRLDQAIAAMNQWRCNAESEGESSAHKDSNSNRLLSTLIKTTRTAVDIITNGT